MQLSLQGSAATRKEDVTAEQRNFEKRKAHLTDISRTACPSYTQTPHITAFTTRSILHNCKQHYC